MHKSQFQGVSWFSALCIWLVILVYLMNSYWVTYLTCSGRWVMYMFSSGRKNMLLMPWGTLPEDFMLVSYLISLLFISTYPWAGSRVCEYVNVHKLFWIDLWCQDCLLNCVWNWFLFEWKLSCFQVGLSLLIFLLWRTFVRPPAGSMKKILATVVAIATLCTWKKLAGNIFVDGVLFLLWLKYFPCPC